MGNVNKIAYAASAVLLASSFFVKDNAKAVKRRYWALGIAGVVFIADHFKLIKIK